MPIDWEKTSEFIQKQLEKDEELESEFSGRILSGLQANLSQQRSMVTHLAIVSGALASFSLLRLGSSYGLSKTFLVLAIITLLFVIGGSFLLLNRMLDYEHTEFNNMLEEYSDMISKIVESRRNVLENKNAEKYIKDLEKIRQEFKAKREKEGPKEQAKIRWWKTTKHILIWALVLALVFNILSLIL